jgi:hypothetical protein
MGGEPTVREPLPSRMSEARTINTAPDRMSSASQANPAYKGDVARLEEVRTKVTEKPAVSAAVDKVAVMMDKAKAEPDTKKAQALSTAAEVAAVAASRKLAGDSDYRDLMLKAKAGYSDWAKTLSDEQLALYGMDDVRTARLDRDKLNAQVKYWSDLIQLDRDKMGKPPSADAMLFELGMKLAQQVNPKDFVKDGNFNEKEYSKALGNVPSAQRGLQILANLTGVSGEAFVDMIRKEPFRLFGVIPIGGAEWTNEASNPQPPTTYATKGQSSAAADAYLSKYGK